MYGWVGKTADLRGETETGLTVVAPGAYVRRTQPIEGDEGWEAELKLTCGEATVGEAGPRAALRYGLTNLDLDGAARFVVEGHEVTIRCVPGFEEILQEIQELRGIGVTAEATVMVGLEQGNRADELMEKVCLLLSLCSGRGVVWVYRQALDAEGHVLEAVHIDARTKAWSNQELVPAECIEAFVAATYPTLVANYERWGLRNAIRSYIDALLESDYLEFRALKLVVIMEYLRERHCEGQGRTSFRRDVARMCSALRVPMSEEELALLKDARNKLVHEATFLREKASPSVHEQYLFLMAVEGRTLLATVGYEGEWYDWRGASDGNGPRRTACRLAPVA
jgi:hypothetical protein